MLCAADFLWPEQRTSPLLVFACSPPKEKCHSVEDKRLEVATLNKKILFHKQSLRHRQLANVGASRIEPNLHEHGDWPHNEERIEWRVNNLVQAHHHFQKRD